MFMYWDLVNLKTSVNNHNTFIQNVSLNLWNMNTSVNSIFSTCLVNLNVGVNSINLCLQNVSMNL